MTQRDVRIFLADVRTACSAIEAFVAGKTLEDYSRDIQLRSAVERQLEIAGEALNQTLKLDPRLNAQVSEARRIVAFRNRLAHAYFDISDDLAWAAVLKVRRLREQVEALQHELGG